MKFSLQVISLMLMVKLLCIRPSSSNPVEALITVIDMAGERAKEMYESLSSVNNITPEAVVLAYLETIPVIGTIVKIFDDNKIDTQKLILNKLDAISKRQEDAMKLMETLQKKIDFIVENNQITESTSSISSCSVEKINFLRNANLAPQQNRIISCYDTIMKDIRVIARILTEKEATLPKFFQVTIKSDGFCDGSKILNAYKYLLGNIVGGCETAIIAERLKYNGTSELLLQECKEIIKDVTDHLKAIFRNCTGDSCDIIQGILTGIIQSSSNRDADFLLKQISDKFPWFTFSLLRFTAKSELEIIGNLVPSMKNFYAENFYACVLWTPYETRNGTLDSVTGFSLQFNPENLKNAAIAMNVSKNLESNPAYIMSNVVKDNSLVYQACPNSEISITDRQTNANVGNAAYWCSWLILICSVLSINNILYE